jgi:outer membrane protein assembly factor BamB
MQGISLMKCFVLTVTWAGIIFCGCAMPNPAFSQPTDNCSDIILADDLLDSTCFGSINGINHPNYAITLTSDARAAQIATPIKVRIFISDENTKKALCCCRVRLSVDQGEIVSITNRSKTSLLPFCTKTVYGTTNASGIVETEITSSLTGKVQISATVSTLIGTTSATLFLWFFSADDEYWPDWPIFHGRYSTGVTSNVLGQNPSGIKKIWAVRLKGSGGPESNFSRYKWSSPVGGNGYVFAGTNKGWLYAFQSRSCTPTLIASEQLDGSSIHGTPSYINNILYVTTEEGTGIGKGCLYMVWPNRNTSHFDRLSTWNSPQGMLSGPPIVFSTDIFVAGSDGRIRCVYICDPVNHPDVNGIELPGAPGQNSPKQDHNHPCRPIWIADASGAITEICPFERTNKKLWIGDGEPFTSDCVFYKGNTFIGGGKYIYRLTDNGTSIISERLEMPSPVNSTPALYDDNVYVGCINGDFCCTSAIGSKFEDSTIKKTNLESPIFASPVVCSSTGIVFVATATGDLFGLDADDLTKKLWKYHIRDDLGYEVSLYSSPAIIDGRLFVIVGDAKNRYLYCFGEDPDKEAIGQ